MMYSILPLSVLLLLLAMTGGANAQNITVLVVTCETKRDLYELLYSICVRDYVCAFVYAIDDGMHRHRHNHFWHQMRVFNLFSHSVWTNHSVSHGRWPTHIQVLYDANASSCYNLTNLTAEESALFNAVALDRLKTHKQYFSQQACPHRNERLLYDNVTHTFHCHCPADRDCSGSSTHTSTITILYGLTLGFFGLILLVVFFVGIRVAAR